MLECFPITLLKGVVYGEDSNQPKTEPCGTPNISSHNSERAESVLIALNRCL